MVAVPAATPSVTPLVALIDAVPGALLLQVPPAVELLNVTELPLHTERVPAIGDAGAATVTFVVVALVKVPSVLHVPVPVQVSTQ